MGAVAKLDEEREKRRAPVRTPEAQERLMVNLAYDLAEKQMREGTASAQVIAHWLKVGSAREELEREKLRLENEFTGAKIEAQKSAARVEELYEGAINAMRSYQGNDPNADLDLGEDF